MIYTDAELKVPKPSKRSVAVRRKDAFVAALPEPTPEPEPVKPEMILGEDGISRSPGVHMVYLARLAGAPRRRPSA